MPHVRRSRLSPWRKEGVLAAVETGRVVPDDRRSAWPTSGYVLSRRRPARRDSPAGASPGRARVEHYRARGNLAGAGGAPAATADRPGLGTGAVQSRGASTWWAVTYADDAAMQVSHETIYRSLFVQSRGVLKKTLLQHLRRRRAIRRARGASGHGQGRGQIVDAVSIRERPAAVEDRAGPAIGKATCWRGQLTRTSPRSSNASRGM